MRLNHVNHVNSATCTLYGLVLHCCDRCLVDVKAECPTSSVGRALMGLNPMSDEHFLSPCFSNDYKDILCVGNATGYGYKYIILIDKLSVAGTAALRFRHWPSSMPV